MKANRISVSRARAYLPLALVLTACGGPETQDQGVMTRSELQAIPGTSIVSEQQATEWEFRGGTGGVGHGQLGTLFNGHHNRFVKYDDRLGVNLNWIESASQNIRFLRELGAGELKYGEKIAIGVKDGGNWEYLFHKSQDIGINLSSRTNVPQYDWRVYGGAVGSAIRFGERVRLRNETNGKFVVYCVRPTGVNLAWRNDCHNVPAAGRVYVP